MSITHFLQRMLSGRSGTKDVYSFEYQYRAELEHIWSHNEPPQEFVIQQVHEKPGTVTMFFSRRRPNSTAWSIAFTAAFRKSVAAVDKKLQGRVLEALAELSQTPTTILGDTKKPLTGELQGLWRYRVGEYRLVYEPVAEVQQVVLLEFSARGSVYDQ